MYTSITKILEAGLSKTELVSLAENDARDVADIDFESDTDALVTRVNSFIAKADSWIDSYLDARFTVPLTSAPATIEELSTRRTIYLLNESRHRKDMPESLILLNDRDEKYLTKVQKGDVTPPGLTEKVSASTFIRTDRTSSNKTFNDDFMDDF